MKNQTLAQRDERADTNTTNPGAQHQEGAQPIYVCNVTDIAGGHTDWAQRPEPLAQGPNASDQENILYGPSTVPKKPKQSTINEHLTRCVQAETKQQKPAVVDDAVDMNAA